MSKWIDEITVFISGFLIGMMLVVTPTLYKYVKHQGFVEGRDAALKEANPDGIPVTTVQYPNGSIYWYYHTTPEYIRKRECKK